MLANFAFGMVSRMPGSLGGPGVVGVSGAEGVDAGDSWLESRDGGAGGASILTLHTGHSLLLQDYNRFSDLRCARYRYILC